MKNGKAIVKIDKGIPLPNLRGAPRNPMVLVMSKMKDGDSFLYPIVKRTHICGWARQAGIVISTRAVDESNIRVWRIKERPTAQR